MKELLFEHMIPYLFSTEEIIIVRNEEEIYNGTVEDFNINEHNEISRLEVNNVVASDFNTKTIYLV